jgi:hypothetical protein
MYRRRGSAGTPYQVPTPHQAGGEYLPSPARFRAVRPAPAYQHACRAADNHNVGTCGRPGEPPAVARSRALSLSLSLSSSLVSLGHHMDRLRKPELNLYLTAHPNNNHRANLI